MTPARRLISASLVLLGVLWLLAACADPGPHPMVFPQAARAGDEDKLGDTVGLAIDTTAIPLQLGYGIEQYDLSVDNVVIELVSQTPSQTIYATITPRAVFSARLPDSAKFGRGYNEVLPGNSATIAVFDLPGAQDLGTAGLTLPATVNVRPLFKGVPAPGSYLSALTILDPPHSVPASLPGTPTLFSAISDPVEMQPKPMIRLRPNKPGFATQTSWQIGAIAFTLEYPDAFVSGPEAFPATDAAKATVLVGPPVAGQSGTSTVRIVLVDPKGFSLHEDGDPGHAGDGPLLDVVFQKLQGFTASQFHFQDLHVNDIDGVTQIDVPGSADSYFTALAVKNQ